MQEQEHKHTVTQDTGLTWPGQVREHFSILIRAKLFCVLLGAIWGSC